MITISILGLDQYVAGHYSKDHTANLAQLFETSEDNISFYAPNSYMFHNGVEQTSWDTIVRVNAPCKFRVMEDKVANYILKTLKDFTINLAVEFYYFEPENRHEYINKEYPRFIKEDNIVNANDEELGEDDELCEDNMFEGFEEKLEEAKKCGDHCTCGEHHKH